MGRSSLDRSNLERDDLANSWFDAVCEHIDRSVESCDGVVDGNVSVAIRELCRIPATKKWINSAEKFPETDGHVACSAEAGVIDECSQTLRMEPRVESAMSRDARPNAAFRADCDDLDVEVGTVSLRESFHNSDGLLRPIDV